tara:strand:+ start:62928 stop:63134 length:207 start_codon:yes stop_codon:yes gene_type:complete
MYVPWFSKPETEKKVLQIVNLSPDVSVLDKIEEVHPMKQVAVMSVVQVLVFGFMLLSFWLINLGLGKI